MAINLPFFLIYLIRAITIGPISAIIARTPQIIPFTLLPLSLYS